MTETENIQMTMEEAQAILAEDKKRRAAQAEYQRLWRLSERSKFLKARALMGLPPLKRGRPMLQFVMTPEAGGESQILTYAGLVQRFDKDLATMVRFHFTKGLYPDQPKTMRGFTFTLKKEEGAS